MVSTLVFHPVTPLYFVPLLLLSLLTPFKISHHIIFAADSRVGNQRYEKADKSLSTNIDVIMANLIYITLV